MKCPGQDMQYWKPGAIFNAKCPECGRQVEFFKDDTARTCDQCGHRFANPKLDFGCAAYCQYAEQCIGTLPPEIVAQQQNLLKDRVALEMKKHLKSDFKRISHATRTARYAERIGQREGGNLAVILTAAYLHDLNHVDTPQSQEPSVAEAILTRLGAQPELIEEVLAVIRAEQPADPDESPNANVLADAIRIAHLEERHKKIPLQAEEITGYIDSTLLTESGRREARKVFGLEE